MSTATVLSKPRLRSAPRISADLGGSRPAGGHARAAAKDLLGLAAGLIPFGISLGITATALNIGPAATVIGAGAVFAGTAQLTAMSLLAHGAALLVVLGSATVTNARLLLYAVALEPRFTGQPRWFRFLGPHFIIDATYLAAESRDDLRHPSDFRRYWLTLGSLLLAVWTASVGLGILVGPALPSLPHVGFVGTGMFLAMLVPRLTTQPGLAAAATAAAVAPITSLVAPTFAILAGTGAGLAAGILAARRAS